MYPTPELQAAVNLVSDWMHDYDIATTFDIARKKSPLLDLAERIRAAESAAVAEERERVIELLEEQIEATLKLAEYYDATTKYDDEARVQLAIVRALQSILSVYRSRASGGNGGGEEGDENGN